MKLPKAKTENIVVQNLKDETLIYDLTTNQAFCLNETLKIIYEACDGKTDFSDLKRKHRRLNDDVILLGVNELSRENLLTENFESGVSRRALLQKAAFSAIALPVIIGIVAPKSAQALSCLADGAVCSLNAPGACCSLTCINGEPNPTCGNTCIADGNPCAVNNPGACCSLTCISGQPTPTCGNTCIKKGSPCSLDAPGACCSLTCINGLPTPTCL